MTLIDKDLRDMFEKGQELEILIEDISDQGQGIGHIDGFTVFVNGAMPGDKAVVSLTKVKKRYAFANVKRISQPSGARTASPCPYSEECGGCVFMGYDYDAELELKARQVRDKLERLGGLEDPLVRDIIGMQEPWRYRNKAVFQISVSGVNQEKDQGIRKSNKNSSSNAQVSVGFNRVRTHDVIDCKDCILQSPAAVAAAEALRIYLQENDYCKSIKNMTVKTAFGTGEVMVVIGTDGGDVPDIEELIGLMDDAVYQTGCSLESFYVDGSFTGKAKGKGAGKGGIKAGAKKEPELIAGSKVINESIGGMKFEISPWSFYQVNPVMMEALYDTVVEYASIGKADGDSIDDEDLWTHEDLQIREDPRAREDPWARLNGESGSTLLDLYCGVGSIGLWCLRSLAGNVFVLGIETERQAVLDANRNAVINGIVDARYICGKAEEVMPELIGSKSGVDGGFENKSGSGTDGGFENGDGTNEVGEANDAGSNRHKYDEELHNAAVKASIAIVDPPRSGCDEALLDALVNVGPEKIVYVSCDPATLARDIKILCEKGYRFEEATPVDMFPHTGHVESIALLERVSNRKADAKVHIDVDLEDYYRIKDAQGKDGK